MVHDTTEYFKFITTTLRSNYTYRFNIIWGYFLQLYRGVNVHTKAIGLLQANELPLVISDCSTSKVECVQKDFDLIFDIIYMYVLVCLGEKKPNLKKKSEVPNIFTNMYKNVCELCSSVCFFFLICLSLHYTELH